LLSFELGEELEEKWILGIEELREKLEHEEKKLLGMALLETMELEEGTKELWALLAALQFLELCEELEVLYEVKWSLGIEESWETVEQE
ncbi:hypothetical protein L7F22_062293, partial [Adiantum nelumboides]|nr:hypothetical protein [Adiantum nelumboides]